MTIPSNLCAPTRLLVLCNLEKVSCGSVCYHFPQELWNWTHLNDGGDWVWHPMDLARKEEDLPTPFQKDPRF